ncbi:MAG: GxxExxY protein [Candidatus Tritonobacter lacicola]|nr:GxxExxY protein [Candidatus Tritonobacter lacicola]
MKYEKLTQEVIGCAIEVHRVLGPGLLETTYEQCLARELSLNDIPFKLQVPIPIEYKGVKLDCGYRIDILVRNKLIVELKSAKKNTSYPRSSDSHVYEIVRHYGRIDY